MLRRRRTQTLCSNCKKKVPYGSYHCRGNDELNAYWICTEMPEVGPPGPGSVSPKEPNVMVVRSSWPSLPDTELVEQQIREAFSKFRESNAFTPPELTDMRLSELEETILGILSDDGGITSVLVVRSKSPEGH